MLSVPGGLSISERSGCQLRETNHPLPFAHPSLLTNGTMGNDRGRVSVHPMQEELKNATTTVYFGFVVAENSGREITLLS